MHCKLEETGGTTGRARTTSTSFNPWAARYNTWLLIKLTPRGVVFSYSLILRKTFVSRKSRRCVKRPAGTESLPYKNAGNILCIHCNKFSMRLKQRMHTAHESNLTQSTRVAVMMYAGGGGGRGVAIGCDKQQQKYLAVTPWLACHPIQHCNRVMPLYSPPWQPPLSKRRTLHTEGLQQRNVALENSNEERVKTSESCEDGRCLGKLSSALWGASKAVHFHIGGALCACPCAGHKPSIGRCCQLQRTVQLS